MAENNITPVSVENLKMFSDLVEATWGTMPDPIPPLEIKSSLSAYSWPEIIQASGIIADENNPQHAEVLAKFQSFKSAGQTHTIHHADEAANRNCRIIGILERECEDGSLAPLTFEMIDSYWSEWPNLTNSECPGGYMQGQFSQMLRDKTNVRRYIIGDDDVVAALKKIKIKSWGYDKSGTDAVGTMHETYDYVYPLALSEIYGESATTYTKRSAEQTDEGAQYSYFANKYINSTNVSGAKLSVPYSSRTTRTNSTSLFINVQLTGKADTVTGMNGNTTTQYCFSL